MQSNGLLVEVGMNSPIRLGVDRGVTIRTIYLDLTSEKQHIVAYRVCLPSETMLEFFGQTTTEQLPALCQE